MRKTMLLSLFLLFASLVWAEGKPGWRWTGVELVGLEPLPPKGEVLALLPFQPGDPLHPYDAEGKMRNPVDKDQVVRRLKEAWPGREFTVSCVLFSDEKAYLVVDLVDPTLPPAPLRNFDLAQSPPEELFALRQALEERRQVLFSKGEPPVENAEPGYLTFDDPECSSLASQLAEKTPPLRERLIKLVLSHKESLVRAYAAELLNWSHDHQANLDAVILAMTDPDPTVRNNATRYLMAFTSRLTDADGRRRLLVALAAQMVQPSHADRNKALYAVNSLLVDWPEDSEVARQLTEATVSRLARQSVLPNVGAIAQLLLKRWHPPQNP